MKIKTLLLTAALGISGVISTRAQTNGVTTYAQNTVGYVSLSLQTGFSMIANPLNNVTNDARSILTNVPSGSMLYFSGANSQLVSTTFQGGTWSPLDDTLNPGGGALLFLPQPTSLTFVGVVPEGNLSNTIPAGLSIESLQVPISVSLTNSQANFPTAEGDTIYRFNNASGQFVVATYSHGAFQPADVVPAVGESFFVLKGAAAVWNVSFAVNEATPRHWSTRYGAALGLDSAPGAFAQGTVNFCNLAGAFYQPILDTNGVALNTNGAVNFKAELMAGPDSSHLALIPGSITPIVDGEFYGGSVTIPNPPTNGLVTLQVVAWDGSAAPDYATAVQNGAATGGSAPFNAVVSLAGYPVPPATMSGLGSFEVKVQTGVKTTGETLLISLVSTNVVFNWTAATNILLQKTTSLSSTNWLDITASKGLGNYSEPLGKTNAFYRTVAR